MGRRMSHATPQFEDAACPEPHSLCHAELVFLGSTSMLTMVGTIASLLTNASGNQLPRTLCALQMANKTGRTRDPGGWIPWAYPGTHIGRHGG